MVVATFLVSRWLLGDQLYVLDGSRVRRRRRHRRHHRRPRRRRRDRPDHRVLHLRVAPAGAFHRRRQPHRRGHQHHQRPRPRHALDGGCPPSSWWRRSSSPTSRPASTASPSPPSACCRPPASSWPSTPTARSPTTPAASPRCRTWARGARPHRQARRRRQHHGGDRQGLRHRLGGAHRPGPVRRLQDHRRPQGARPHRPDGDGRPVHRRHAAVPVQLAGDEGGGARRLQHDRGGAAPVPQHPRADGGHRGLRTTPAASTSPPGRPSARWWRRACWR